MLIFRLLSGLEFLRLADTILAIWPFGQNGMVLHIHVERALVE